MPIFLQSSKPLHKNSFCLWQSCKMFCLEKCKIMKIDVLRFTELNQYGLPRAVGEVEMSLGTLKLHVFPHQVEKLIN